MLVRVAFVLCLVIPSVVHAGTHRWTPTGPEGGAVPQIVAAPSLPGTVWAVAGGRAYRSTDGGAHWTLRSAGLPIYGIERLLIDATQPTTLLATTFGLGVYRTTDDGATWARVLPFGSVGSLVDLIQDPVSPSSLYAVGRYVRRVLRSVDHGATWSVIGTSPGAGADSFDGFGVDPNTAGTFYAFLFHLGTYQFLSSTNFGTTWTAHGAPVAENWSGFFVAPTNPTKLWRVRPGGLQYSTDGGDTWTQAGLGRTDVRVIAVDPTDPTVLFSPGAGGLLRSPDDGATWQAIGVHVPGLPSALLSFAIDPANTSRYWVGTAADGVILSTDAGASWTYAGSGLSRVRDVCTVVAAPGGTTVHAIAGIGVWTSTDGGVSWQPTSPDPTPGGAEPVTTSLAMDPTDASTLYATTLADGVFKTTNGGDSWQPASAGLPGAGAKGVVVDPTAPAVLYAATTSGVYRSTDGGSSWALRGPGSFTAIDIDPSTPTTLYLDHGLYKSTDGGASTFTPSVFASLVSPPPNTVIFGNVTLAIAPSLPSTVYAGASLSIYTPSGFSGNVFDLYRSLDGLGTTSTVNSAVGPSALAVDPVDPDTVYVGSADRAQRSRTGGSALAPFDAGLRGTPCMFAIGAPGTPYYAATYQTYGTTREYGLYVLDDDPCAVDADCDDGTDCTIDTCNASRCEHAAVADGTACATVEAECTEGGTCYSGECFALSLCNDGNPCTNDVCLVGGCSHEPVFGCVPCTTAADCDDADGCTTDTCVDQGTGKVCHHQAVVCDDGDPCTTDACVAGACTSTFNPAVCAVPCTIDPSVCDDDDPCTIDSCVSGACSSVTDPAVCTDSRVTSGTLAIAVKSTAKIKFLTRDSAIAFPALGSADDPSVAGVTVEMFAAGAPVKTLTIPPGIGQPGWRAPSVGAPSYRYDNRLTPYGPSPVRTLVFTSAPLIKLLSKSLLSTLATGTHPSIGIRVTTGTHRVCAVFGGDTVRVNKPGHFTAKGTMLPSGDCAASALAH